MASSFSPPMEEINWTTSYCLDEPGFPKVLYAAMTRLGIMEHPEYIGREYEEAGTERCEVTIHIGASEDHPDVKPWSVATTGFRFADTYQSVARKALRYLCQMYEGPISRTSIRFFPPLDKDQPGWKVRLATLGGLGTREDDPTVVAMTRYLLALDELHDRQEDHLRACICRAEEAEEHIRTLRVQLAEAKVQAAEAESRSTAATIALKDAEDRHTRMLNQAYLTGRAHNKTLRLPGVRECPILDAIPLNSALSIKRKFVETVPVAPPPSEASEEEKPLLLTQPLPTEKEKEVTPTPSREAFVEKLMDVSLD